MNILLEERELQWRRQEERRIERWQQEEYERRRDRAIQILTETAEEREKHEAREIYNKRRNYLEQKIAHYKNNPCNFDRTSSEIFGTKKGLTDEGMWPVIVSIISFLLFRALTSNIIIVFIVRERVWLQDPQGKRGWNNQKWQHRSLWIS